MQDQDKAETRGREVHMNIRILHAGSKAQDKGDPRIHMVCGILVYIPYTFFHPDVQAVFWALKKHRHDWRRLKPASAVQ